MAGRVSSPEAFEWLPISGQGFKSRPQAGGGSGAAAPESEATERSEGDREFRCHVSYRELRSH